MQVYIEHSLPEQLVLPLNYHHILQSIIYYSLQDETEFSSFLHEEGYSFSERKYRMFVFGLLKGHYKISDEKIIFDDRVSFEVRSPDPQFIQRLSKGMQRGIKYLDQQYDRINVKLNDKTINSDCVRIKMLSPLCVYSTDSNTGKTRFYLPEEDEFYIRINENFKRKYYAYTGIYPDSGIVLAPIRVTSRDKYVTKYKGFYLSGWLGVYELRGEPKYLDFLYQTGLGSKNAQGFGLFEVL